MSVTHRKDSGGGSTADNAEIMQALNELRGNSGAATATDRSLTALEKIALMAASVTESAAPSQEPKAGYMWRRYYDASGAIMWEQVADPDYVEPQGTYLNPVTYTAGMEVEAGLWYTDGASIWECIQSGTPSGFDDTAYFDIIVV